MALSLDGTGTANTGAGTSVSFSLTTTAGSGVIVVLYVGNAAPAGVPTATGLTFIQRINNNDGSDWWAEYEAPYTSNFSGTITVTASSSTFITALGFGIGGAATTSSFDPNGSLPVTSNPNGASASTTNPNDFIFGMVVAAGITYNNPWTIISSTADSNFCSAAYQIVSSTQSGLNFPTSGNRGLMDAVVQATATVWKPLVKLQRNWLSRRGLG